MKSHIRQENRLISAIYVILLALTAAVCTVYFFALQIAAHTYPDSTCTPLNQNWLVTTADSVSHSTNLPAQIKALPNESVTMSKELPATSLPAQAIYFRSTFQTVSVSCDTQVIYEYDSASIRPFGKASASRWILVQIPDPYAGSTVQITLASPYASSSGYLPSVYFGTYADLNNYIYSHNLLGYLISFSLFIIGVLLFFASLVFIKINPQLLPLRYVGLFAILMTYWLFGTTKFPISTQWNILFASLISYIAMMLCPLPYILFLKCYVPNQYHRFYNVLFLLFSVNFTISVLLQLFNIADYPETIFSTYCLVCIMVAFIFLFHLRERKNKPIGSLTHSVGVVLFALCFLTQFFLDSSPFPEFKGVFFSFGTFIYVLTLIIVVIQNIFNQKVLDTHLSEELLKHQTAMMISNMQPHFLFNSLGAIQSLIKKSPDTAYNMMFDFSKYLRSSMLAWENQVLIPFSAELEYTKAFSNIQLIRFRDAFDIIYEIEATDFSVPILSVRALVENAVNHGVRKAAYKGCVWIRTYALPDCHMVEVSDNGVGFHAEETISHYESAPSLQRIQFLLERDLNAAIQVQSAPGKGTTVILRIPKDKEVDA